MNITEYGLYYAEIRNFVGEIYGEGTLTKLTREMNKRLAEMVETAVENGVDPEEAGLKANVVSTKLDILSQVVLVKKTFKGKNKSKVVELLRAIADELEAI